MEYTLVLKKNHKNSPFLIWLLYTHHNVQVLKYNLLHCRLSVLLNFFFVSFICSKALSTWQFMADTSLPFCVFSGTVIYSRADFKCFPWKLLPQSFIWRILLIAKPHHHLFNCIVEFFHICDKLLSVLFWIQLIIVMMHNPVDIHTDMIYLIYQLFKLLSDFRVIVWRPAD